MARNDTHNFMVNEFVGMDMSKGPGLIDANHAQIALNVSTDDGNLSTVREDVALHYDEDDLVLDMGVVNTYKSGAGDGINSPYELLIVAKGNAVYASENGVTLKKICEYAAVNETRVFKGLYGTATYFIGDEAYGFFCTGKRGKITGDTQASDAGNSVWYIKTSKYESGDPLPLATAITLPTLIVDKDWQDYRLMASHRDRLFLSGNPAAPYNIIYSEGGDPTQFDDSGFALDDPARPGTFDVANLDIGHVVGIYAAFDELVILCANGAARLTGYNPNDFALTVIPCGLKPYGGRFGLAILSGRVYVPCQEGLCIYNGARISLMEQSKMIRLSVAREAFAYNNNLYLQTTLSEIICLVYNPVRDSFVMLVNITPRAILNGALLSTSGFTIDEVSGTTGGIFSAFVGDGWRYCMWFSGEIFSLAANARKRITRMYGVGDGYDKVDTSLSINILAYKRNNPKLIMRDLILQHHTHFNKRINTNGDAISFFITNYALTDESLTFRGFTISGGLQFEIELEEM